jgi:alkylation response protein AidB-like acyl-CoA dehydrogenase
MVTDFAEVHDELRSVARDLLGKSGPAGVDWSSVADAGWLGLEIPEALGGAGATLAEVAVVLKEMGRAATASPYLGTAVLGVGALNLLEPTPARDALLSLVAAGDRTLAVALPVLAPEIVVETTTSGAGSAGNPPFRLERSPDGRLRVHGRAGFVVDAPGADRLLLVAQGGGGDGEAGPVVVVVHDAAGLDVADQPVLDATRTLSTVTAEGVEVRDDQVWRFAGDAEAAVRRLHDRAAVALACDSLGVAEAMLDATVAYAKVRHQFGRPIGSFQAVKHACADMLVQVSVGRELVAKAVQALAADGTIDPATAASMAKSYVCAAAVDVAGKAMQLHGGIGYTWESGVHVYLKRAALNRELFGSPRAHRRRLAARYPVLS